LDQAIASDEPDSIRAELGDLLLHLAFQIVLAEDSGRFGPEDVARTIEEKMWQRHPHLFELGASPETWERSKLGERGTAQRSVLDGLPAKLPTIIMAFRLQERAAGVGFDWPDAHGPREKVREELEELEVEIAAAGSGERIEEELGDLLFAIVNLARKLGHDPRTALEKANSRFIERFRAVEGMAAERGIDLATAGLEVLDGLWDEVKETRIPQR
jgi:MazG family protein